MFTGLFAAAWVAIIVANPETAASTAAVLASVGGYLLNRFGKEKSDSTTDAG